MFWHRDNDQGTLPIAKEQNHTSDSKYRTSFQWSGEVVYISASCPVPTFTKQKFQQILQHLRDSMRPSGHHYLQKSCVDSQKCPKKYLLDLLMWPLWTHEKIAELSTVEHLKPNQNFQNHLIVLLIFQGGKHDPGSTFWCVLWLQNSYRGQNPGAECKQKGSLLTKISQKIIEPSTNKNTDKVTTEKA